MSSPPLGGVIAAIATPVDAAGAPDAARFVTLARYLLAEGCDGLNVLGTTGEATSFSVAQRLALMQAAAGSGLPMHRLMVGTGAAAAADAAVLTRAAAELGFAGALLLPPFYYKSVPDDGLVRHVGIVAEAAPALPLYLYNFPALSGLAWSVPLVARLLDLFAGRLAGLKDSSGDLNYAREMAGLAPGFAVFPSNEACLIEARSGVFAGCISATANLNARYCAAAWRMGDTEALAAAVAIRRLFDGLALVPAVKAALAELIGDPALALTAAPLTSLPAEARARLVQGIRAATGALSLAPPITA